MNFKIIILYYYIKHKFIIKMSSKNKLDAYQNKKIKKHLDYIVKHSKFYSEYKGKKLNEFPIIDKNIMMTNFNEMNTVGLNKDKAIQIAINSEKSRDFKVKYGKITVGLSSGTSGSRGLFIASDFERAKWTGIILSKLLPSLIFKKQKIALFLRSDSELYNSVNSKILKFSFFDMINDYNNNIKKLNELKPDILIAPASMLKILAENTDKMDIKPKKIYSCAEVLTKSDRLYINRALNTKIGEIYQATEGFLGYSLNSEMGLCINEDLIYVEKEYIDIEKTRFIPIITDFERKSQPIIRYRLNDIWVENNEKNDVILMLSNIEGREDDIFVFLDDSGNKIKIFPDFIRRVFMLNFDEILEYNVIQKSLNEIIVSFVPMNSNQYKDISIKIREKLYDLFDKSSVDIKNIVINFSDYEVKDKLSKRRDIKSLL